MCECGHDATTDLGVSPARWPATGGDSVNRADYQARSRAAHQQSAKGTHVSHMYFCTRLVTDDSVWAFSYRSVHVSRRGRTPMFRYWRGIKSRCPRLSFLTFCLLFFFF